MAINIQEAMAAELKTLKGIGAVSANKLVRLQEQGEVKI